MTEPKVNWKQMSKRAVQLVAGEITPLEAIDSIPQQSRKPMAKLKAIANAAAAAVKKYGPEIANQVEQQLQKSTGGKVGSVSQLGEYVGSDVRRMKVAADAMVSAGMNPNDVLPADMTGSVGQLAEIRAGVMKKVNQLGAQFQAGSDRSLAQGPDAIAADMLRKVRVQSALAVFGNKERYFHCIPKGGIPIEDFVWFEQMFTRR